MTVLAFDDTGGGRRALLLVHGFILDRHVWDDVVPRAGRRIAGTLPRAKSTPADSAPRTWQPVSVA